MANGSNSNNHPELEETEGKQNLYRVDHHNQLLFFASTTNGRRFMKTTLLTVSLCYTDVSV